MIEWNRVESHLTLNRAEILASKYHIQVPSNKPPIMVRSEEKKSLFHYLPNDKHPRTPHKQKTRQLHANVSPLAFRRPFWLFLQSKSMYCIF
mmetsp:Transcript_18926/g.38884  ORF Transcript_18926/g.38884 Transcript_18926/m.38884 type:complete len:92 (-) Transcript_18926:2366-2641(-)